MFYAAPGTSQATKESVERCMFVEVCRNDVRCVNILVSDMMMDARSFSRPRGVRYAARVALQY